MCWSATDMSLTSLCGAARANADAWTVVAEHCVELERLCALAARPWPEHWRACVEELEWTLAVFGAEDADVATQHVFGVADGVRAAAIYDREWLPRVNAAVPAALSTYVRATVSDERWAAATANRPAPHDEDAQLAVVDALLHSERGRFN